MKKIKISLFIVVSMTLTIITSCQGYLDPYEYGIMSRDKIYKISKYVDNIPFSIYSRLPMTTGCGMTSATDESENVNSNDYSQDFNKGTWHTNSSGDNIWTSAYKGIRTSCDYLDGTDTLTWHQFSSNRVTYLTRIRALSQGRGEARFLRAYLYFELMKRYGKVPLIKDRIDITPDMDYTKFHLASIQEIVDFICQECDIVTSEGKYKLTEQQKNELTNNGTKYIPVPYRDTLPTLYDLTGNNSADLGRATKAAAFALKAKTLIYFASPQFNTENNTARWIEAAKACKKVMDLPSSHYDLEAQYEAIFDRKSAWSKEFLFVRKAGASQSFEAANFPIALTKGSTGICPSQNLVDAYEYLENSNSAVPFDWNNETHKTNIYSKRDPRMAATIYVNNEQYASAAPNNKKLEIYNGGNCDPAKYLASKTGYYLKKYIDPLLDLNKSASTSTKTWILMRMADYYLFYAEAMNEAYGAPNLDPEGIGMTALDAINKIRQRAGMPNVTTISKTEFRSKIYTERQVELAFENHRWSDVRRWMKGDDYFNAELKGVTISKSGNTFTYTQKVVEQRIYNQSKMNFYIINPMELRKLAAIMNEKAETI